MPRYLISFDDRASTFPEEDLLEVARASQAVVVAAKRAGVWVYGAGVSGHRVSVVGPDLSVYDDHGANPIGGFCVVDVRTREDALRWAAEIAVASRCPQEVRELIYDPEY